MSLRSEWARCKPFILPSLPPETTEQDVEAALLNGRAMLWPGEQSAAITQTGLHIWLGGGALTELRLMERDIATYARTHGGAFVTIAGRPGWKRLGYETLKAPADARRDTEFLLKRL